MPQRQYRRSKEKQMSNTELLEIHTVETPPHIVVGVDGSADGKSALAWAATQASRTNVGLKIVTAIDPNQQYVDNREAQRLMDQILAEAAGEALAVDPGLAISHAQYLGSPSGQLIKESNGAHLLVVGSRGMGGFAGLLLGSVSRKCLHGAECPIVVVRATDSAVRSVDGNKPRIVVGVDGSKSSNAGLLWAGSQAELTGAELEALSAWEWMQSYQWGMVVPNDLDPRADAARMLGKAIEPAGHAFPDVVIDPVVAQGPAADILVKASAGAELLVLGSRGHSEFVGVLIGSVSEHCVTHAQCTVIVMHGPHD
jgi:nucleotide-binding universal stress UspA family protein